jgi:hypothetical protein
MPHPIDHLLQQLEGKTLEFKRDLSSPRKGTAAGEVFDEQPMPELGVDGLDTAAMARVFGPTRALDEKALQTLKLLCAEQGRLVPTRGAVLLFGKAREQHFPDAWIQCGRFRGLDKVDIFDQHEVHAHLPNAVEEIELFLKKRALKTARFGALRREDGLSQPHALNSRATAKKRSDANEQGDSSWPSKGVSEGVNAGVTEGVNAPLALITSQPGLRVPALASNLGTSPKTVDRWLQQLKAAGQIEFRGAPKTGGYHAK